MRILSYYPRLNSFKELQLLIELEELIEMMPPEQLLVSGKAGSPTGGVAGAEHVEGAVARLRQQHSDPLAVYT